MFWSIHTHGECPQCHSNDQIMIAMYNERFGKFVLIKVIRDNQFLVRTTPAMSLSLRMWVIVWVIMICTSVRNFKIHKYYSLHFLWVTRWLVGSLYESYYVAILSEPSLNFVEVHTMTHQISLSVTPMTRRVYTLEK